MLNSRKTPFHLRNLAFFTDRGDNGVAWALTAFEERK